MDTQLQQLSAKLDQFALVLDSGGLPKTASWLRAASKQISSSTIDDLALNYSKEVVNFRDEFSSGNAKMAELFHEVRSRMPKHPPNAPLTITDLETILAKTSATQQQIAKIVSVFNSGALDTEQKFYGMCLLYVIMVEGVYDEVLRFLLLWYENLRGNTILSATLANKNTYTLKSELEASGAKPVLFEFWQPRIRNSIAHARFSYDVKNDKAIFDDVDPHDQTNTFHKEMSYKEFGELETGLLYAMFLVQVLLIMDHYVPEILVRAKQIIDSHPSPVS